MKTIGILGGMGPRVTVEFESRLLEKIEGSDQVLPTIVGINDGGIPDRSSFLLGKGTSPVPRLVQNLNKLKQLRPDFICLPCNSACAPAILSRVQLYSEIPIIDLPVEVVRLMKNQGLNQVMLLATEGLVASGRYQELCHAENIECFTPVASIQAAVSQIIMNVKAGRPESVVGQIKTVRKFVASSNCQAVILGCTELPMVASQLVPASLTAIDTLDALVEATLSRLKTQGD